MVNFIYSPSWFYGIDTVFEAATLLVAIAISIFSYRIYKFSSQKRHFWFGVSFMMLAASFLAKILTNVTSYYNVLERHTFQLADIAYNTAGGSDLFFVYGYAAYRVLTLLAFLGMYLVMTTRVKQSKSAIALLTYLVIALVYFTKRGALAFHITAALILLFIFMFTFRNCYRITNTKTVCVSSAFLMLLVSQLLFIPAIFNSLAYVAAEVTQLMAYTSMLGAYMLIRKSTKEKR